MGQNGILRGGWLQPLAAENAAFGLLTICQMRLLRLRPQINNPPHKCSNAARFRKPFKHPRGSARLRWASALDIVADARVNIGEKGIRCKDDKSSMYYAFQ